MSDRIIAALEKTGALKRGHFRLSSGLHSDRYCQCAALFEHPAVAAEVAAEMAARLRGTLDVDVVLSPALGGILWGYELARALGVRSLFAERDATTRAFALRRGFQLAAGERVLLAEDVVTTGKSVMELVPLVETAGAVVAGYAAVADRSAGRFQPPAPFHALVKLDFQTWQPDAIPDWLAAIPVDKPGSR
jgi:orotate phosphoribosyltransferase